MEVTKQEKQSFACYKANNTIEEGDLVVIYLVRNHATLFLSPSPALLRI